jgi:hypothetical protein
VRRHAGRPDARPASLARALVSKNVKALDFYERIGFTCVEVDEPGGVTYLGRAV